MGLDRVLVVLVPIGFQWFRSGSDGTDLVPVVSIRYQSGSGGFDRALVVPIGTIGTDWSDWNHRIPIGTRSEPAELDRNHRNLIGSYRFSLFLT